MTSFSTTCVHGDTGASSDGYTTAVAPPISVASTFNASDKDFAYSRIDQPNRRSCEQILGKIHQGHAILYASGMAATFAALTYYSPKGVAVQGGYHGTRNAVSILKRTGVVTRTMELDDESLDQLQAGDCVWIETPNNPTCLIYDIATISEKAHARGAKVVVDATFAPPPLQNPLDFGADIVMHSATKYLAGHSDCVIGALVVRDEQVKKDLMDDRTNIGLVPGSLESWLLLRSLRTLKVRVLHQSQSASTLARWLESEEAKSLGVRCVHHPSLESHEGHSVACKQMPGGFGGVLAVELEDRNVAENICSRLKLFKDATSLGGVESLIEWRYKWDTTVSPTLLRLSVGLEEVEDLIQDIRETLSASGE